MNPMTKAAVKIRGRSLRNLRTFMAQNPEFAGHSSKNIGSVLEQKALLSPARQWRAKIPVTRTEAMEAALEHKFSIFGEFLGKPPSEWPVKTYALKNLIPRHDYGFGEGAVLFPLPARYRMIKVPKKKAVSTMAKSEMIMGGKVKVPASSSIFLAPRESLLGLRRKYRNVTILPREEFEKQWPRLTAKYPHLITGMLA